MTADSKQSGPFLGVDIGGTKVAVGLVDRVGKILTQGRKPMVANGTAEAALQAVTGAIDISLMSATADGRLQSIGICAPGPLDPKTGIVLNPPNLPCWRNFPLADEVAKHYHVPVKVDNDANAAALAETRWGAARGHRYVFYATIGTGIGTGIVLDGRIYHGNTGSAGEGGHVSIDYRGPLCPCGKRGCIEVLAAGPAIGARARAKIAAESAKHSAILDLGASRCCRRDQRNGWKGIWRRRSAGAGNSYGDCRGLNALAWQHRRSARSRHSGDGRRRGRDAAAIFR